MIGFKRPRVKNEKHLEFIRSLPCLCCGNDIETEAAHIRAGNEFYGKRPTGGSEKPSDCWTIPLCGRCHREQHKMNERGYWGERNIDPFLVALSLYASSGDFVTGESIINLHRGNCGNDCTSLSGIRESDLAE